MNDTHTRTDTSSQTKRTPRPKVGSGKTANKGSAFGREKSVRVKTARGRRLSSTLWLQRQLNDPYVAAAKSDGYRSRAAYKILDIQKKFKFLKSGMTIIDLGAAPGGWSQVCADIVGSPSGRGKVIAIDIQDMPPLAGVELFHADFTAEGVTSLLTEAAGGKVDAVISDMAPFTTGVQSADHLRILSLVENAVDFAIDILKENGVFVSKMFEGGGGEDLMLRLKQHFKVVKYFKPDASRSDSSEIFLVATGFKNIE